MALNFHDPHDIKKREQILIKRSLKGDATAFEELALIYQQRIYNIALRVLNQAEDAADVTQEVLLKLYRSLPKFRADAAFSTWVYRITVNACRDIMRSGFKQKEGLLLDFGDSTEQEDLRREVADYTSIPENIFIEQETEQYLWALISSLSPKYRLVITLREISGLSYQEISDAVSISLGTVKSRINRARKSMQEQLYRDAEQYPHLRRLIVERGVEDGLP
ncbi:MAG: sigma-70 family RNA polymerase sigma factor [Clostridiales bacterium]|nr:sigma-70 family RNA polymerase sigma factor [Clostridiales bacterium]